MIAPQTIKAIGAVLELDCGATPAIKAAVTRALSSEAQEKSATEEEAARILDISRSTLYAWRNNNWKNAPHPFIFRTWSTPADETRYDVAELIHYNELRRIRCTKETPQPNITDEELQRFVRIQQGKL